MTLIMEQHFDNQIIIEKTAHKIKALYDEIMEKQSKEQ